MLQYAFLPILNKECSIKAIVGVNMYTGMFVIWDIEEAIAEAVANE